MSVYVLSNHILPTGFRVFEPGSQVTVVTCLYLFIFFLKKKETSYDAVSMYLALLINKYLYSSASLVI